MTRWSLKELLSGLHDDIQKRLDIARRALADSPAKGDASENVWLDLLNSYLPRRYQAAKAYVVDSRGTFSQQIDVVVFDRQYSPFIFVYESQTVIPAESVYAVFEAKQVLTAAHVRYAQDKIASVRMLYRTSLPIPYAGGVYPPKPLIPIIGGILTFDSDWSPPLGNALLDALTSGSPEGCINLGCVAARGHFARDDDTGAYTIVHGGKPATAFLLKLISALQLSGTVPMIDVQAYARWLSE